MTFEHYLTYAEYVSLGGKMAEMPFNLLEFEAQKRIDERTLNRLKDETNIPKEVKLCVYNIINSLESSVTNTTSKGGGNVASENIDGYSVSYITGSQVYEAVKSKQKEMDDIITTYLMYTIVNNEHILYLGVK